MAEMGARVIKVEPPKGGDDARAYGPFVKGKSTYFASVNRGKESIALDLKNDEHRTIFEKLLEKADVIVENFRPGTMEKLGYGWDTLHKKYPKLIYASASGFGHSGPNSKDPAYDMVMQGMGGIMSITGNEGQPPARVGMSIGDIGAGLYTAVAVNAALVHRLKTGEATKVDIGMFDCQIALLENAIMRYTVEGEVPGPLGARHPTITPFQAFRTSDGAIIIAAGNDGLFVKTCEALGRSDMATDPDYKTNALRQKHHGKLEREIEAVLKDHTDGALDRRARQGGRAVRADQQHQAGAGASAGRGAQHAGRGSRRQRRHAEARGQSAQDVGLRRPQDATRRRPISTATATPSSPTSAASPCGHPSATIVGRLGAGLAKFLAGTVLAILVFLRRRLLPGARRAAGLQRPCRGEGPEGAGRDPARQERRAAHHCRLDRGCRLRPGLRARPGSLLADGADAPAGPGPAFRDRAAAAGGIGPHRHRSHDARPRNLPQGRRQHERALARHARHRRRLRRRRERLARQRRPAVRPRAHHHQAAVRRPLPAGAVAAGRFAGVGQADGARARRQLAGRAAAAPTRAQDRRRRREIPDRSRRATAAIRPCRWPTRR